MNRSSLKVFIGFMLLVGMTAGLLLKVRSSLNLGKPGVKLVASPLYNEDSNLIASTSVFLPEKVEEFSSIPQPITKMELAMLPPDTVFGRRLYYSEDDSQIGVSVVLMGTDRTSIHKPQYCLVGQGESIVQSEVISIPMSRPAPYELKAMKLTTRSQQRARDGRVIPLSGMFIYWFVADGELTAFHGQRMWWMARDMLTKGVLQRWAYVACFSRCLPGQEDALLHRMKEFIAASVPEFQTTPSGKSDAASSDPAAKPLALVVPEKAFAP